MQHLLAARLFWFLTMIWGVATIAFLLARAAPGDPAELFLERAHGRPPTDEQVAAMRREMGLERPILVQYVTWLAGLARGDLGQSWATGQPVAEALAAGIPPTVALAAAAQLLTLVVGIPLGVAAAARPGAWLDQLSRALAVTSASIPTFVLGYVMILLFAVTLGLLPVFGTGSPAHLVLPAVTLALGSAATYARVVRASMLTTLQEEYIRAASARGVTSRSVLARHALPNALLPVFTMAALSLGHLLGGAVVVEWVFSWPGLGRLTIESIAARDYPLVQGIIVLAAAIFGVVNVLADLALGWIDPRVTLAQRVP